ncbi:hypothetical protein [Glutamicibacter protophormiae]|uniref:Uncharacterized protein n=1 Tax=Glutamicibacter protophormiae TaxID=37930 RepID=A0ABS4XLG3_GLUPR|nr:hypothetical protein [Glutamicibacter protophormiae]MBP2397344.1 hypothetical protein [Glutamicibacter protophormiae]
MHDLVRDIAHGHRRLLGVEVERDLAEKHPIFRGCRQDGKIDVGVD